MKHAIAQAWSLALLVGFVASPTSVSGETVVVRLQNGRQISATIHKRSDDTQLWLQYGSRTVTVIRPVDWETIVGVSLDGDQISIEQLKALVALNGSPALSAAGPTRILRVPPADEHVGQETMANRARKALGFTRRVRSVQFEAVLANWDGDVETDGLLLRLVPIDDQGHVAVVRGTLYVEFVARRQRDFNEAPSQGGSTVDRIGRWTVQLGEADFRAGAATVKLPFQAIHPEFDTDWFGSGLVHVRFTVAGHGTFEQSLDGIRIRPFSPLRDGMQRQSGRRFLPSEGTERGQRSSG